MKKFLFAALMGAAAGMLLAPKKGAEMRRDLKRKLLDNGLDVDDLKSSAGREKVASDIKGRVHDLKERGESLIDSVTGKAHGNAHGEAAESGHEIEVRVLDETEGKANAAHATRKLDDDANNGAT